MQPTIQIRFSDVLPSHVPEALNIVEAIDRDLRKQALGHVDNVDHFRSGVFTVVLESGRWLGRATAIVSKHVTGHRLSSNVAVSRTDLASHRNAL